MGATRGLTTIEITVPREEVEAFHARSEAECRALWSVVEYPNGFGVQHRSMLDEGHVDEFDDRWPTREGAQAALDAALARPLDWNPFANIRLRSVDES